MRVSLLVLILASFGCLRAPSSTRGSRAASRTIEQLLAIQTPRGATPAFPPACRRLGKIAFVAVGRLETLDVSALAERYRRVYGVEIEVLPPLSSVASTYDPQREQLEGTKLLRLLATHYSAATRWVIGVTDEDLFSAERNWRYAFSLRGGPSAIVSTFRTDPPGPLSAQRTMKLISRVLAETWCDLERDGPQESVLCPTMMGPDDLDRIDESVWERGPTRM